MAAENDAEATPTGVAGYIEFEFDLPSALLARLVDVFVEIDEARLTIPNVAKIPDEQGVYQLFLDGTLVYVGKTDGDAGLRSRLSRHATKLLSRHNLDPARVNFKAVRIFVFTAMDLEGDLIRYYGGVSELAWNGSGFGSNDPGKERDTTQVKPTNFDAQFPINIDLPIDFRFIDGETVAAALTRLKSTVPYTLRFQGQGGKSRQPHPDLTQSLVKGLASCQTTRQVLLQLANSLPSGWHITALPGYIIMYKNDNRKFPSGSQIATSP